MSGIHVRDHSSLADAAAGSAPAHPCAVLAPAVERAAFARAVQSAQRRGRHDNGEAGCDRAADDEAPRHKCDRITGAGASPVDAAVTHHERPMTWLSTLPAGVRAACPPARMATAARRMPQPEVAAQEQPTTIELTDPQRPGGTLKLSLSRTDGGGWSLQCGDAATLDSLRGALARLADRFEQRALGRLDVHID
jgi:hypothetical protein